ncbi:peptidoglycan DD-metalloendopeptidase family protein [Moorellaceae bacterium AZ2]
MKRSGNTGGIRSGARILLARSFFKKALAFLAPYLVPVLVAVFLIFGLLLLVAAVYEVMAPMRLLTGVLPSDTGDALLEEYQLLCDEYNIRNTWLVSGEPSAGRSYYPGKGEYIGRLVDRYGSDRKHMLTWGAIHAPALYYTFASGAAEIPDSIIKAAAEELAPYFYYKRSRVTVSGEDGESTSYDVYLLVEASTYTGLYQYRYEWVTKERGDTTVTYEELVDVVQVWDNPYQRLEAFLKKHFKETDGSVPLARDAILEAATGFSRQQARLAWLMGSGIDPAAAVSASMIPPDLMPFFMEAEREYGIPWWFLAAVALRESSFDHRAINSTTGCFGIMQVSPTNWEHYAPRLGFDPEKDRYNPRAQILMGAFLLYEQGLKSVDWEGNWQEQAAPVLAFYVGAGRGEEAVRKAYAMGYIPDIYAYAERFQTYHNAVWPVPGWTEITDTYHPEATLFRRAHHGIDIAAPHGVDAVSVSAGRVEYTGWDAIYGNYIDISDGIYMYRYGHLSRILVSEGEEVLPGKVIGLVGSTGKSSGPHLHFEVHDLAAKTTIDPFLILAR